MATKTVSLRVEITVNDEDDIATGTIERFREWARESTEDTLDEMFNSSLDEANTVEDLPFHGVVVVASLIDDIYSR